MTATASLLAAKTWQVLVVDDSPDDRAEVRRLLLRGSERRYDLAQAETGAAGLRAVLDADRLPDCVVLDYNLPDMDAVEVLAALVGPDGLAACPVVVLTGSVSQEYSRAVLQAGAQDFLGKGWMTPESLTRAVENAVERWAMARELLEHKANIKANAERLQLVIGLAGLGVVSIDYAARTCTPDATAALLFGLEPGVPVPPSAIHDRFHPDDRAAILRLDELGLDPSGDGTIAMEHRVVRPDGSTKWLSVKKQIVFANTAGVRRPVSGVLAAVDVTAKKLAEAELQASEQRTRMATEAARVGIWEWNLRNNTIRWNAQMFSLYGIAPTPGGIVDYTDWSGALLPDELDNNEASLQATIRSCGSSTRSFTIRRRTDGESREVESVETARRNADGNVEWVLGTNLDVTDRSRSERILRESEARLRGILQHSPAGIIQTDAAGCFILVNPRWCEMLGYAEVEMLGRSIFAITQSSHVALTPAAFARLAAGGPDFHIEEIYKRKDGSVLNAQVNIAAIRSPAGEFLGIIAVILDISEHLQSKAKLHRLAAELSEADRRKDLFLATLAHELRNPLAPLCNGLQVMKHLWNNDVALEKVRAMMDRQLSQLIRLVDDLLDVSRITQGKLELRKARIDLRAVVEAAVETSRPVIDQAGHDLAIDVPREPLFVVGDAARLAQVLSNLLNNSSKYTHRGGHIRLTVERERGTVKLSVKDDGIGIPAAMLEKVFGMFTQVDRTLEKTTGGLGIGLSLVKGLIEMHGGTIQASSDGEGMGSEFVFRLPVMTGIGAAPDYDGEQTIEVVPSALRRILVVDDNVDAAHSLGELLAMMGNEVRTAHDGEAGIEVAAQFRPHVMLMDIGMPKLNGYEAARRIRQHAWGHGMLLVALTGWGQEDERKKSAEAGFDHHLVKPVRIDALTKLMSA
ncbi:PAS domain S-box-containing protein [Duganella sp. CF517]|uniref:response regulator n=1 Tax=Duganella sp. CF517 TaxID=1881038 RepID=UPI0008BDC938|nr:response regulator [Duganella sp. CF517]SEO04438.1 PAS domain S-box-containing protein [Duganella sp. CF517]